MPRNIPLFIAFRLLFNARFYYPIFAVIQLDYGLTMEQFALLNAIWAVSIVLLEVPSGALADKIGRKRCVVAAGFLMIVEMAVIAFVPLGNNAIVFGAWVVNRILSGAAEAAASGADEALAYDSLPADQRQSRWPAVLSRLMTLSSLAFVVAMLVGAAVYDPAAVTGTLGFFGIDAALTKSDVLRWPIYLTLLTGVLATGAALLMKEPPQDTHCRGETTLWSGIISAGAWILKTPVVLAIILAALIHDSLVRLFLTTNSEYYRLIHIEDRYFGLIGAAFAGLGLITPRIARGMVEKDGIARNYFVVSLLVFVGLLCVAQAWPIYGVLVVVFFGFSFGFLNFFTSHYLNAKVDSAHRATVLSFKGLALNLGFGALSLLYGALLRGLRDGAPVLAEAAETATRPPDPAFRESLYWLPGTFLVMLAPLAIYYFAVVRNNGGSSASKPSQP